MTSTTTYDIRHATRYEYGEPVSISHHLARLRPRELAHQECLHHELEIVPAPSIASTHTDYFGNPTEFLSVQGAHRVLEVRARSRVVMRSREVVAPEETPAWEAAIDRGALPLDAVECTFNPPSLEVNAEIADYARGSFPAGRPLLDAVLDLTARIHGDFVFDPRVTTVATPLADAFRLRRGVCQDFARLEIACLRTLGLAAHYVSGYLETTPPPGTPRQMGADASHAWLAVYCPGAGWIDVDPTNNLLPTTSHVTLAWGRDYGDVSPLRGVMLGGGAHSLSVEVDMIRETPDAES